MMLKIRKCTKRMRYVRETQEPVGKEIQTAKVGTMKENTEEKRERKEEGREGGRKLERKREEKRKCWIYKPCK